MNFPTSPSIGQVYTLGDRSWKWDGIAWTIQPNILTYKTINGTNIIGTGNIEINRGIFIHVLSSTYTASAYQEIALDTTLNACTLTLPISATEGQWVDIFDYAGTFNLNHLTISGDIGGTANSILVNRNFAKIHCLYLNNTWNLYYTDFYRFSSLNTPILVGQEYVNEYGTAELYIVNYNFRDGYYTVTVPAGTSYVLNGNTIEWTFLDTISVNTQYTLEITFTTLEGTSAPATHTVTVLEVPAVADTMINITNLATNSYTTGWTI